MVSTRSIQRAFIGAIVGLALAACGAPASEVRHLPSESAVATVTASPSESVNSAFPSSSPSPEAPTTAAAAPPSATPVAVVPAPAAPAPAAPAPAVQAPAPVVPAAPVAPADPGPAAQPPAAPNTVQGIIPGAFCPNADVGMQGIAANCRSYVCGGKGADKNGHYHWNV
jgi:hypothetical protein